MGSVVTRAQQAAAFDGIRQLMGEAAAVCGGFEPPAIDGVDPDKSAFVAPTLLRTDDATEAEAVHEVEVFGPAATVVPYRDEQEAAVLVRRGGGSLVASIYGEDRNFLARMAREIGPSHGRLLLVDPSIAAAHTGHGIVMPQCNHGGPGRAATAKSWADCMVCASITSGWRCRDRAISWRRCRLMQPACIDERHRGAARPRGCRELPGWRRRRPVRRGPRAWPPGSTRDHRRPGISFSMSLPFGRVQCTSVPKAKASAATGAIARLKRPDGR
jgi:hypothetical protein